jgi:hypothetical protein
MFFTITAPTPLISSPTSGTGGAAGTVAGWGGVTTGCSARVWAGVAAGSGATGEGVATSTGASAWAEGPAVRAASEIER